MTPNKDNADLVARRCQVQGTRLAAYRTLIAAVFCASVVLGLPLAYGVFQSHYSKDFPSSHVAPWIGVLSTGLPFLSAPAVVYSCQYYSLDLRYYMLAGWLLCVCSLLASTFSTSLQVLVVTQGLMYGLGAALVELPLLSLINTWFSTRRGLAYGIIFGGTDLMSIGYTFLIAHLLPAYGLKITMAVLTAIVFSLAGPPMLLLSTRDERSPTLPDPGSSVSSGTAPVAIPSQPQSNWHTKVSCHRYFQRPIYYILASANLLQAFAFYLPFIYLPSFTTDLGHSTTMSALILSAANLAQVFGEVGFGQLSDKIHVKYLVIVSTTVASLSAFILWGLFSATSLAAVFIFALIFGTFGSGFIALWARFGTLFGEKDAQMVYSTMCFGRGVGNIASGPISSMLLSHSGQAIHRLHFGASKYAGVVVFVGVCMAGSAVVGVCGILVLSRKDKLTNIEKPLDSEASSRMSWELST